MNTARLELRENFQWSRSSAIGIVLATHAFAVLVMLMPPMMEPIPRPLEHAADPIVVIPEPKPEPIIPVKQLLPILHKTPKPVLKTASPRTREQIAPTMESPIAEPTVPPATATDATDLGESLPPLADTAPSALAYAKMSVVPYPIASAKRREQGRVMLRVLVGIDGIVQKVEIEASSGFAALDRAARDAVAKWRFTPGTRNGVAFAAWGLVPIEFKLNAL